MADTSGFEFDFTDFNARMAKAMLETVPEAAEKGMFLALGELKNDCDRVQPKTPLLEGNLRGDYDLVLEGITQSKVESTGSSGAKPAKATERFGAGSILGKIIFRMPYAEKWHEAVGKKVAWSEPGSGPKFLEMKITMFARKYFGIIADSCRGVLK